MLPLDFNPDAKAPLWGKCLQKWLGGDAKQQARSLALQQFFGYVLLPHARYKKALFLLGPTDSRKIPGHRDTKSDGGKPNICVIPVNEMSDPRKVAPIKGKMINIVTELPSKYH